MVGRTGVWGTDRTREVIYDLAEAELPWPSCIFVYRILNNLGKPLNLLTPLDLLLDLIKQRFCLADRLTPSGEAHGNKDLHCQRMLRVGELLMGICNTCIYSRKRA
jgi:hypothetical protein